MPTNNHDISLTDVRTALNDAGDPWEAGTTSMSSLPVDEQQARLGVRPPPGEASVTEAAERAKANQADIRAKALMAVGAPAAYDLRDVGGKNFVTPITDQKSCGSCVAFGVVATVESRLRVQRGDPNLAIDLSEAHLYFCHARARGANCDTGWWPAAAYEDFKSKGVVDEACYPYDLANRDCSGLCSNAGDRLTKITGATTLTGKPADIKTWVSTNGPVTACFVVYQDFFSYTKGVYKHVTGGEAGGHCVTIVGYNDSQGYWTCKNSWGKNWGENGYFRIGYGECAIDTWGNFGVDAIENTGWQNNKQVIGLWTIDQERNAWAYFATLGWRKISADSDNAFYLMLSELIAAKAAARPVNFYEEQSVIKQAYVF